MLKDFAISVLESALSYFVTHAQTQHRQWQALYGKPILLRLEQPKMVLYCVLHAHAVTLRPAAEHETVSVSISTDYTTLLQILRGQDSRSSITIQGQAKVAQLLARYIKKFQPDLKAMLSPIIGESSAYAVSSQIRQAAQRLSKDWQRLHDSTGDYIVHECQLTPSKPALQQFYRDVDQLSNRIDLLEQRISYLDPQGEDYPK